MRTKLKEINSEVNINHYDIIIVTETWLNDNINDGEVFNAQYNIYRRDRASSALSGKDGGGVLVAVSKAYDSVRAIMWETAAEDLWVRLTIGNGRKLNICAVYLPPPLKQQQLDAFLNAVTCVSDSTAEDTIVIGDFNLGFIEWSLDDQTVSATNAIPTNYNNNLGFSLVDFMSTNSFSQYNFVANDNSKLLDLVFSSLKNVVVEKSISPICKLDSHHPALIINLDFKVHVPLKPKQSNMYNFKSADYKLINSKLSSIDWKQCLNKCSEVDLMTDVFYESLWKIIKEHVPKRKRLNHKYPPWYSRALVGVLKDKEKLRVRFKRHGNPRDEMEYRLIDKRARVLIKNCYRKYVQSTENSIRSNPKTFWSFIKTKNSRHNAIPSEIKLNDIVASSGDAICNIFASQFSSVFCGSTDPCLLNDTVHPMLPQNTLSKIAFTEREVLKAINKIDAAKGAGPDGIPPLFIKKCARHLTLPLTLIFNKSLASSLFPTVWKRAKVVPIFKKGDCTDAKNYRPISLLSIFSKIFESLICPILTSHVKPQLSSSQHGFCSSKSTETNLISYVDDLCKSVDSGQQIDALYADFSSAFDKVDHQILLMKLQCHGIHGELLKWFESYLHQRTQQVVVNGYHSFEYYATSGVPQGSHTGPILFITFVNDIVQCFRHSHCSLFADDLKIYRQVNIQEDVALLQSDLDALQNWCDRNKMALNVSKCYHITFTRKKRPIPSTYSLNGTLIDQVKNIRDLGIVISSDLSFTEHINMVIKKANKMVGFISRMSKDFRNTQTIKILYNSLVRSHLEYASAVWNPVYDVHINRIERVQKKITRLLRYKDHQCPYRADYAQRLSYFHLSSLKQRRVLIDLCTLYKIVNGLVSAPDLLSRVLLEVPRQSYVRAVKLNRTFVVIPSRTNLGQHAPLNRMVSSYNNICAQNRDIDIFFDRVTTFKAKVLEL